MDIKAILEDFQDYLAPKLDTYEQAIYLYILRHSRLQGLDDAVIGFKSARKDMALGIGEKGKSMSEHTCYEKLRSRQAKGCVEVVASERKGTRVRLRLPSEISGVVPVAQAVTELSLEEMDFFAVPPNRAAILSREGNECFYCLRTLTAETVVVEHIVSRPLGNNSYRNVVAGCRACNNRKGETDGASFIRSLYRSSLLDESECEGRLQALAEVQAGKRRPILRNEA